MATDNTLDIVMDQGSSLTYVFNLKNANLDPIDLTGYDVRMQVRKTYGAANSVISCTLSNNKVILTNASLGIITLALLPSDTSGIRFNEVDDDTLECVYDLEVQSTLGVVFKPARGNFTLNREVTR